MFGRSVIEVDKPLSQRCSGDVFLNRMLMKKNTLFSVGATLACSQFMLSSCLSLEEGKQPNFVVIFCDDMGYGDLGCYGNPTIHTPNLDRMASEGMKFTQFYVGAPVSTPSRSALLTGRLPVRNGMYGDKRDVLFPDSKAGLGQDEVTIARLLQQNGYATACVGKWHLGHFSPYLPTDHGFDEFFGIPYSNDMRPACLMNGNAVLEEKTDQGELTKRYTEYAVNYIRENRERPFFLYLAHTFPHTPLYTNERFGGKSNRGLYGDVVEELDWSVGEVLKALKENGLDENTLVVFTSDNGPWLVKRLNGGSSGPLREGKSTCWEGGQRVPAIFRMPGKIAPGTQRGLMATMDILPTFLNMAGIALPDSLVLDGVDQTSMLWQQSESARDEMFFWRGSKLMAVRKGPWKIHFSTLSKPYTREAVWEHPEVPYLYNVEEDVSEQYEVSAKHPEVVEALVKLAEKHQAEMVLKPSVCDFGR